jgi:curli production assembly/transport component CsgE
MSRIFCGLSKPVRARKALALFLLAPWLLSCHAAHGSAAAEKRPASRDNPAADRHLIGNYNGLVLDQTVTKLGQSFLHFFLPAWRENSLSDRYTITVCEKADARRASQVWIEYGQRKVFQAFLPPADNVIRDYAEKASAIVYENIVGADAQRLLFRDDDLAVDELQ